MYHKHFEDSLTFRRAQFKLLLMLNVLLLVSLVTISHVNVKSKTLQKGFSCSHLIPAGFTLFLKRFQPVM